MKRSNTIVENIEFLISMYERDLEHPEDYTPEELEDFENIIIELKTIIEFSK
jgi:hypothetical protein